ncbi:MAG: type II toxin-antitoxin system HicB family antitoxin [Chloroflexi bacterium]|nr:type II toxin-antitoxin system HicB family antitoxin [Chloroflexota bacterium]
MRTIEVVFYREGNAWVAQALNVDVSSFGETREEARVAIQEALELYFEDAPDSDVIQVANVEVETLSVGTV